MANRYYLGRMRPDSALNREQMPDGPRAMIAHVGGRIDEIFACDHVPTTASHGERYAAVVGPFRTKRAAVFMSRTAPNPHCRTVAEAERLVKLHPKLGTVPQ